MIKKLVFLLLLVLAFGCASLETPQATNIAVSTVLNQLQIAINKVSAETKGSGLPPFQSAELTLSTKAVTTTQGSASLVLAAKGGKNTTGARIITLELVSSPPSHKLFTENQIISGEEIADHIIASVKAVDSQKLLKLKSLTLEAGLEVFEVAGGGIKVELVGIAFEGERSKSSASGHGMKLTFAYPERSK